MAGEVAVTIVAVQDIFQEEAGKKSIFSDEYKDLSARIILDRQDMASLGAKEGDRMLVKSEGASIVVAAKISGDQSHPGLAFMFSSPWFNQLVSEKVIDAASDPNRYPNRDADRDAEALKFKSIEAAVTVTGKDVTAISELFAKINE